MAKHQRDVGAISEQLQSIHLGGGKGTTRFQGLVEASDEADLERGGCVGWCSSTANAHRPALLHSPVLSNDIVDGDCGVTLAAMRSCQFLNADVGAGCGHGTGDEDALDAVEGFDLHSL